MARSASYYLSRLVVLAIILAALGSLTALGIYAYGRNSYSNIVAAGNGNAPAPTAAQIARGHYLALAGDCVACHTAPGGQPYAGGLALNTGFGIVDASNITPDRATGIGGWSTRQFILAVKYGIGDHGKRLYPAMPYNDYAKVSDSDLTDMKAYLDTLPPVSHAVVANQMPFPFSIRLMMLGWNLLFFDSAPYKNIPTQSAAWNRGAYLVQGLEHCAACHTGKNLLGGDISSHYLTGFTLQGWYAPNITDAPRIGLAAWSAADIATYLKTGANAHAVAAGPMAEAVHNSTQYLTDADLQAIALYLKSQQDAAPAPAIIPPYDAAMQDGAAVYAVNCEACHSSAGTGVAGMVPALAGSPAVQQPIPTDAVRTILLGGRGAITLADPTGAAMPPFSWKLSDSQIADVATYIRNNWGNQAAPVQPGDVTTMRATLHARQVAP